MQEQEDQDIKRLCDIADKMVLGERLLDMNQVMEITTLSRQYILDMEARGEFPERLQVGRKRYAWKLSTIVKWINNLPLRSHFYCVERPEEVSEVLRSKIERVQSNALAGRSKYIG